MRSRNKQQLAKERGGRLCNMSKHEYHQRAQRLEATPPKNWCCGELLTWEVMSKLYLAVESNRHDRPGGSLARSQASLAGALERRTAWGKPVWNATYEAQWLAVTPNAMSEGTWGILLKDLGSGIRDIRELVFASRCTLRHDARNTQGLPQGDALNSKPYQQFACSR